MLQCHYYMALGLLPTEYKLTQIHSGVPESLEISLNRSCMEKKNGTYNEKTLAYLHEKKSYLVAILQLTFFSNGLGKKTKQIIQKV